MCAKSGGCPLSSAVRLTEFTPKSYNRRTRRGHAGHALREPIPGGDLFMQDRFATTDHRAVRVDGRRYVHVRVSAAPLKTRGPAIVYVRVANSPHDWRKVPDIRPHRNEVFGMYARDKRASDDFFDFPRNGPTIRIVKSIEQIYSVAFAFDQTGSPIISAWRATRAAWQLSVLKRSLLTCPF